MKQSSLVILVSVLFLATTSPVVMVWGWETDQVDQCQTRGGSFDYEAMSCDAVGSSHPFVPFVARHPSLVTFTKLGWLIAGIGAAMAMVAVRKRDRSTVGLS